MVELRFEQGVFRLCTGDGGDTQRVTVRDGDLESFGRWARQVRDGFGSACLISRDLPAHHFMIHR